MKFAAVILLLSAALFAQDKIKPLTSDEELSIRTPQVRALTAQANLQAAQASYAAAKAELDAANAEMTKAVDTVYATRHLVKADAALCATAGLGPCANAPTDRLSLQPIVAQKKEEARKSDPPNKP